MRSKSEIQGCISSNRIFSFRLHKQFNLGTQYYFGRGVEKNETEALVWYRRAADNGHPRAMALFESEARISDRAGSTGNDGTKVDWIRERAIHLAPAHTTSSSQLFFVTMSRYVTGSVATACSSSR